MRATRSAGRPSTLVLLVLSTLAFASAVTVARADAGAVRPADSRRGTTIGVLPPAEPPADARRSTGSRVARPTVTRGPAPPYRDFEGALTPLEAALFADAADGRLDQHSLLAAALIAGGTESSEQIQRYEARLDALAEELRRSGKVTGTPRQQARAIFEFMHRQVLRGGYQLNSSDLAAALDEGRFNCVSASVLLNCLAGRFGLVARGLEVPGHAMSRLVLPDGDVDVETTCPRWFELMGDPKQQADLVAQTTGFRHPDKLSSGHRREVAGAELVATIYYNRGVDLLAENRFVEALAANAKALRLDPGNLTARGNLLATLNNWAISVGRSGRYEEAVALLRQGMAIEPAYETFCANDAHVHHQWVERLLGEERFTEALDVLAEAAAERPEVTYFCQGQFEIYRRWGRALLAAGQPDRAMAVFRDARRRYGDTRDVLDAEAAALNDHALELLGQGRFEEAVAVLDRGLALQPDSALLGDNRRAAVMRWAEPAFLSGDWAEAIRRTTLGAKPGQLHETLAGNVAYGYHQWIKRLEADGRRVEAEQVRRQAQADPFLAGRAKGHDG
jgi:tetratricopeptide (TPR) repeat protein